MNYSKNSLIRLFFSRNIFAVSRLIFSWRLLICSCSILAVMAGISFPSILCEAKTPLVLKPLNLSSQSDFPDKHPVLGSTPSYCRGWAARKFRKNLPVAPKMNDMLYRRMINLSIPDDWTQRWSYQYGEIETLAAKQLCVRLKGCTEADILRLLGTPACKEDCCLSDDSSAFRLATYDDGLANSAPRIQKPVNH